MITASKSVSANDDLIAGISRYFIVKDLGVPRFILGQYVHIYGRNHIAISQELYISKIKDKYNLGGQAPDTPSIKDHPVKQSSDDPVTVTDERAKRYYWSLLGTLLYCTVDFRELY